MTQRTGTSEKTGSVIHRYGMSGGAKCGAGPDKFGHLKISLTGAPAAVTCPACKEPAPMTREAALAAIHEAAKQYRKERCTVHASPDCLDPDGPTYNGSGWDHDGADQRIECSACAKVLGS